MEKPEWCKCEGHEHEINIHSKECCFCGCKPPTKKVKFSEVFDMETKGMAVSTEGGTTYKLLWKLAKTLDHFLEPIEVPDEEGEK